MRPAPLILVAASALASLSARAQSSSDPTRNLESPFPVGTGLTFSASASGGGSSTAGGSVLGVRHSFGGSGFVLETAFSGATSGSGAGAGASATTSPHPSGALKVGVGYDTSLRQDASDESGDAGFVLSAAVKAVYAIEDFLQACTSSPQLLSHVSLLGPKDYLGTLNSIAALPDAAPTATDLSTPIIHLTLGDLKNALAPPPSKWKSGVSAVNCKATLDELASLLQNVSFESGHGTNARAQMSDAQVCGRLKKDGIVSCRTGGTAAAATSSGYGLQLVQFPAMGAAWHAAALADPNEFFVGISVLPNLIQVGYLPQLAAGGADLTAKPLNEFVWPWSLALDMFWARNQTYFLGLEIGGGQGLPSVTESNICSTTTSGTTTAQTCQSAALSKPSLGTSLYGTFAFLVPQIPGLSQGSVSLGAELLATFASITNPSMASQTPFSSATDTLVLTVPIFLGSISAPAPSSGGGKGSGAGGTSQGSGTALGASILGGLAPQVTLPFDSTKPATFALTVFVGGSNFF